MEPKIVVALAGNPNSGKTTVFNALTGAHQHVGNYPGVTVERKTGICHHHGTELQIVDLPGTYSLTAYSTEELVARNFIIEERPDVVVVILDAANLERNLYLAVQLMELAVPRVVVLNMSDMAAARGYEFDIAKLAHRLGARVVTTVGHQGTGMGELLDAVVATAADGVPGTPASAPPTARPGGDSPVISYGPTIETEITRIEALIRADPATPGRYDPRWLAVKLLEHDRALGEMLNAPVISSQVAHSSERIVAVTGEHPETAVAGKRYEFIADLCQEAVRSTVETRHTPSDRIDAVATHRVLGIPVFLGLMYVVFQLTFTLGAPPMEWIEWCFGRLGELITGWWPAGSGSLLQSLLVDGIIGGVGGVIVFLPNILLLFLAIAVLEDTGYMARVAFITDRLMHRIGLEGKSFIPMLIGFGCSVPAIMATRTLSDRRARLTTMLVTPLMSCGARLPIYALFIPAFFPSQWHAPLLWIIYVTGVVLAIAVAKLLRSTILRGETAPFVMELPPYRVPTLTGVLIHMWERGRLYLQKAGTVILGISIVLWGMTTFPGMPDDMTAQFAAKRQAVAVADLGADARDEQLAALDNAEQEAALQHSLAGRMGHVMEPVLRPMGFDWRIGTALIGAFAAKEVFVAQMGIVYAVGATDETSATLRGKLREDYSPLIGFCVMLFCLVSAPCMATIAITGRESGSWRWALLQLAGLTVLAYAVTVLVYQAGTAVGLGG